MICKKCKGKIERIGKTHLAECVKCGKVYVLDDSFDDKKKVKTALQAEESAPAVIKANGTNAKKVVSKPKKSTVKPKETDAEPKNEEKRAILPYDMMALGAVGVVYGIGLFLGYIFRWVR